MAKKFGDVVTLVRNGVPLNALVAQSNAQPDGEHLTVLFLDPAFDSPIIGGSALQRAVSTAFAVPFKDGQANGWKEVEVLSEDQLSQIQANSADAQAKDDAQWEKQLEEATIEAANLRLTITTLNEQKAELLKPKVLRFGMGEVAVVPGRSNDQPAVTIAPVDAPGGVVLEFHSAEGAQVLIQDVAGLFPPAQETPKEQ